VIKLLVTYFQRNHSKEVCGYSKSFSVILPKLVLLSNNLLMLGYRQVLDLMVRMLGFSEEDKQRIGFAQNNAGKGVVRGVLGLPGRLVGGIVGGGSSGKSTQASQDSQVGSIYLIPVFNDPFLLPLKFI
jgi:hypothetical protein